MSISRDKTPDIDLVFAGLRTNEKSAPRVRQASTIAAFGYHTPEEEFGDVERGNPLPYTLDAQRRFASTAKTESAFRVSRIGET